MILPDTNISVIDVRNATGTPSTDIGTLCRSENVNKYSRYRPGYWYVDTSGNLQFQRPRGWGTNDPRGSRFGYAYEAYALGDFRGYNTLAPAPSLNNGSDFYEVVVASEGGGSTREFEIVMNLGEVDWFSEETEFRGRNNIPASYDTVYAERKVGTSWSVIGSCHKDDLERSGHTARAPLNVSLAVPSSGSTNYELRFGLGDAGKVYARFPNTLTFRVTRLSGAYVIVRTTTDAVASLKTRLQVPSGYGDTASDLYQILVYNGQKEYESAVTAAAFTQLSLVAEMLSHNQYILTAPRLTVTGTAKCYNKPMNESGATLKSSKSFTANLATNGYGLYTGQFPLSEPANDGEYHYLDITGFGSGTVGCQPV